MEARRARRREKKKQRMARKENITCIVFLATDEESFELVCPQKGPPKGQTPAADGEDLVDGDDK